MLRAASSLSSLLLLLLVLLLVLVLVLVRVVVVVVLVVVLVVIVVVVVVGLVVVVLVVVSVVVVVVVIVVVAVAAWSCGRCRCYLCSWYFFCKPLKIVKSTVFANPQKASNRRCFAIFHILGTKNTVNTDVFGSAPTQNHGIYEVLSLCEQKSQYLQCFVARA